MDRREFLQSAVTAVGAVIVGSELVTRPAFAKGDDYKLDTMFHKTDRMYPKYLRACRYLKMAPEDIGTIRVFEVRMEDFPEGGIPAINREWKRLGDLREGDEFCVLGPEGYETDESPCFFREGDEFCVLGPEGYETDESPCLPEKKAVVQYWRAVKDAEPEEGLSSARVTCDPIVPPPYHPFV
jgi:hypothetical protein